MSKKSATFEEEVEGMTQAEERIQQAIISSRDEEKRRRLAAEKKLQEEKVRTSELTAQLASLQEKLSAKMDETNAALTQLTQYMLGNGPVTISDTLKTAITEGVREEFEKREKAIKASYENLYADMQLKLAARENEIRRLRNIDSDDNDTPITPSTGDADVTRTMTQCEINALKFQRDNLAGALYGQTTESGKYHHGSQQTENSDDLDIEGADVPDERVVEIARQVKTRKCMLGIKKPRREQPLFTMAKGTEDDIVYKPDNMPADAEYVGEDVSVRYRFVKGYIRTIIIRREKYKDSQGNSYHTNLPEKYLNCMGRMQVEESIIAQVLTYHFHYKMTLSDIEDWLKNSGLNFSHSTIMGWIDKSANLFEVLDAPLRNEITSCGDEHSDETTLGCRDKRLPGKGEKEEDVEDELHFFKRWLFCHHSLDLKLTQFVFHERGGRTQEAIKEYFKDVNEKLYLHSDGAPLYKCYDVGELILRVACMVHMRRPFYKLKDASGDAEYIMNVFDEAFHQDRLIKEKFTNPDDIKRERILQLTQHLLDLEKYLIDLQKKLEKEEEPELLKAVNYALKEYPCLLRCLEDGRLDLSNNCCERQIRKIAKYRNNSFFVCSPASGVRFARMMSVFANIKQNSLDPIEYLTDVFRRIKNTAKDQLVNLLPHKWQPLAAIEMV